MRYRISTLLLFVVLCLILAAFFVPRFRTTESSENRTLATFSMVIHPDPDSVTYRESPVERLDAALSDQFPLREKLVRGYLRIINRSEQLSVSLARKLIPRMKDQYILHAAGSYELIEDTNYITAQPPISPMDENLVSRHVEQIEYLHRTVPELRFYVYYVTQAYDTDWFDNYLGTKTADNYRQILDAVPEYVRCGHLVYRDLDDYMNIHYKTDHHWNHLGSRRGYLDIYETMSKDFPMGEALVPQGEFNISEAYDVYYLGSYGRSLGDLYDGGYDSFSFYEYDFPEETYAILNTDTLEETEAVSIGSYDDYRDGWFDTEIGTDHYIELYYAAIDTDGNRYTEQYPYIIRNSSGNGRKLLICGDSYSRALRDPLAAHFDTLVYVDYRILKNIPVDYLIRRYDIDTLLINSNTSMWGNKNFFFRFEEEEAE